MFKTTIFSLFMSLFFVLNLSAQEKGGILFSGVVVQGDSLKAVSYTTILVLNKNLGTISTKEGYFSFYAQESDSIRFSAVGYASAIFVIPNTITTERYSVIQIMRSDTLLLAETIIYPWPANEKDFKESFLNDDIEDDQVVQAKKNIEISAIQQPKQVVFHETSAAYNYDEDMKKIANKMYYNGQMPPMTVLDPIAWWKFIQAWRRGDFKKKE